MQRNFWIFFERLWPHKIRNSDCFMALGVENPEWENPLEFFATEQNKSGILIERWFRHSQKIRIFSSWVTFFLIEVHSWSWLFNSWAFILQRLSILGSLILLFSDSVYHVRQSLFNPYSLVIGLWLKEKLLRLIPYFFQNNFWKFIL